MKGTKFFRAEIALAACVLALLMAVEVGFISVAWAGKPPKTTTSYGYATLTDTASYVIWSDGKGQYIDKNKGGEDMVEITTDNQTSALVRSKTVLGIVERQSTRRVRFLFDVYDDAVSRPGEGKAVYDILVWTDNTKTSRRNLSDGTTVRFRVIDDIDDVAFIIDPGWDGKSPNAITQTTVNNFYSNDTDEIYYGSVYEHVIYYLDYPSGITAEGAKPTWTIAPSGSPTLYVLKRTGKGKAPVYTWMDLATYVNLPFQLTVSLDSISAAPRKHNTLSTAWGKIKAK